MKHLVVLVAALAFSAPASARSVEVCPELPADSNLVWSHHEGPDFDVCYAAEPGSDATAFGVYLGNAPSFNPDDGARIGKGRVAGRRVVWYRHGASPLDRQTLLMLDRKSGYAAHIWVAAESDQQLQNRLSVLERIAFKR